MFLLINFRTSSDSLPVRFPFFTAQRVRRAVFFSSSDSSFHAFQITWRTSGPCPDVSAVRNFGKKTREKKSLRKESQRKTTKRCKKKKRNSEKKSPIRGLKKEENQTGQEYADCGSR